MPPDDTTSFRLSAVERQLENQTEALNKIGEAINRFSLLEERHLETRGALERAFHALEKADHALEQVDKRVSSIELAMPQLQETRKWVILGILGGLGLMGAALLKLVFVR
jgi:hypothetical protein